MSRADLTASIEEVAGRLGPLVRRNAPLGQRTTYRVGGPAALLATCLDQAGLEAVAGAVGASGVPTLVLGRGSNLLVADRGFAGLVVALAGFVCLLHDFHAGRGLPLRLVLFAGAALVALCVVLPPAGSKDVASYALYGRMVSEYGENPYTTVPDDHPEDPWYPDVSTRWRQTPSVYGPAFTVLSAAITGAGGEHRTLIRVLFQASAGLALWPGPPWSPGSPATPRPPPLSP